MIGTDRAGKTQPGAILTEAAAMGIRARAGYRPAGNSVAIGTCPAEAARVAPAGAVAVLERLLSDPDAALIEEWSLLARAKGLRVADSVAPALLDWWGRQPQRPDSVFLVLGKRGEWLASMNPAWRKPVAGDAIPADAEEVWQTGKTPERLAALMTVRRHDPARALSMVRATWSSDGADERRRWVEVLLENRSMADEPFLEDALDDKSKIVRRQAAAVLGQIRGSRLRARMTERAKAMIIVEAGRKGPLRRGAAKVSLSPPSEFEKAWERDGIEEQAASGIGKKAWWMRQVLSLADLSLWTGLTGLDPEGVLEAIAKDDYFDETIGALVGAVNLAADPEWAAVLAGAFLRTKRPWQEFSVWRALPDREGETVVLRVAGHERFGVEERWMILGSHDRPWSPGFSREAMAVLITNAPTKRDASWHLSEAAERISRRLWPGAIDDFEGAISANFPDELPGQLKRAVDRVRLRADMHKEFAS